MVPTAAYTKSVGRPTRRLLTEELHKMKQLASLLMILALSVFTVGCGGDTATDDAAPGNDATDTDTTEDAAEGGAAAGDDATDADKTEDAAEGETPAPEAP
jgi:hypothetical protein